MRFLRSCFSRSFSLPLVACVLFSRLVFAAAGCICMTNTPLEMGKSVAATSKKVNNYIPDDLAFTILSKLPPKSLKRFGCIRKLWALLFQDPHFMSVYRNNFISRNHSYYDNTSLLLGETLLVGSEFHTAFYLLCDERFENRVKLHLPPPVQKLEKHIFILGSGSINGTRCLSMGYQEKIVVFWNPGTDEFKVIPPSPVESMPPYRRAEPFFHGFGYDNARDDYKALRWVYFDSLTYNDIHILGLPLGVDASTDISYDPLWEIYSLRSNSWRKLDVDVPLALGRSDRHLQVYIDGMCHWAGRSEPDSYEAAYLVSFDMCNEVFFTTLMPSDMDDNFDFKRVHRQLVVLNGSIALISYYDNTTTFHISTLGEIGVKESWTKLFIAGPLPSIEHPIGAGKKGIIFLKNKDRELVMFDLSTQMIEDLSVKGKMTCDQKIVIYKESFHSSRGLNH